MTRGGICLALAAGLAVLALAGEVRAAGNEARPTASQPLLFTADEVQYDQDLGLTVAKGNVEISEGDQILLADTVTYNQRTDTVTATGHVSLMQPTGDIAFADFMELHDHLRDGFIKDIRILRSDSSRMAGNTARRSDGGTRTELRRGVYSPCELCADDPSRPPVWQIKAERIVDDTDKHVVEYYDATMEIDGIPVFYMPYMSHPDPSVKRASGFLSPSIGTGNNLGYNVTVPYFWAIDKDKDITFRPMITSGKGVMLDQDYRQAFDYGKLNIEGSVALGGAQVQTGPLNFATTSDNPTSIRGHINGTGIFDLNNDWRTGFDVERESDQAYMQLYKFAQPADFLTSHVYAEDFGPRSYGNISAYSFQSLFPTVGDGAQPIILPTASYDWTSEPDKIGGLLSVNGNLLNLERHAGPEMQRVSGGMKWRLPFNGPIGDRFDFSVSARVDGYYSNNVPITLNTNLPPPTEFSGSQSAASGRVFPQGALLWSYPWVRHDQGTREVIEPKAAFVAAPNGGNPAQIPNEDSQGYEFDETSLFRPNRLPGYDVVDSGQRVDYGLHIGTYNETYGNWDMLAGQSYRLERSSPFNIQPGSGLEDQISDVVGRLNFTPVDLFTLFYRLRLAHSDLAMERQEAGFSAGPPNLRFGASLISVSNIPGLTSLQTGTQVSANISAALNRYWSLKLNDTRNISSGGATIYSGVSLIYQDDCFAVETTVQRNGIDIGDVSPGITVMLTFVFKNLGEIQEQVLSAFSNGS